MYSKVAEDPRHHTILSLDHKIKPINLTTNVAAVWRNKFFYRELENNRKLKEFQER